MKRPALILHVDEGAMRGMRFPWKDGDTLGRESANAVVLKDNGASRRHARIHVGPEGWVVEDLGSRNGTYVNGNIVVRHALSEGDRVQIGHTILRCELAAPPAETEVPPSPPGEPAVTEAIAKQSLDFLNSPPAADDPLQVARAHERLIALFAFARAAAEAPSLEILWEKAAAAASRSLAADRAFILRPVGRGGAWEPFRPTPAALARAPLSQSVVACVRDRGDSVLCRAPGSDRRFSGSRSLAGGAVSSLVCVPVRLEGGVLGALYADRIGDAPPFGRSDLELAIAFAIALATPWAQAERVAELLAGRAALERDEASRHDLVGVSPALREVQRLIDRAAPTEAPVLITGESGVGKELVARAIHRSSPRAKGPFEAVNCAALTESLFESELFGHAKGSFTGADSDRSGRFELADRGTLFLDEVGDLPEACQTKLLRILEDGRLRRVGDTADRPVDVRVVAATNRPLEGEGSRFRQDLFYRLNVLRIEVPPLRSRPADVPVLAAHFALRFSATCRKSARTLSPEALSVLAAHEWPGNVRELKNCLERMVVLSDRPLLEAEDVPQDIRRGAGRMAALAAVQLSGGSPLVPLEDLEREHILRVLEALGGNKKRASEVLGIDRGTLYAKLRRYGVSDDGA